MGGGGDGGGAGGDGRGGGRNHGGGDGVVMVRNPYLRLRAEMTMFSSSGASLNTVQKCSYCHATPPPLSVGRRAVRHGAFSVSAYTSNVLRGVTCSGHVAFELAPDIELSSARRNPHILVWKSLCHRLCVVHPPSDDAQLFEWYAVNARRCMRPDAHCLLQLELRACERRATRVRCVGTVGPCRRAPASARVCAGGRETDERGSRAAEAYTVLAGWRPRRRAWARRRWRSAQRRSSPAGARVGERRLGGGAALLSGGPDRLAPASACVGSTIGGALPSSASQRRPGSTAGRLLGTRISEAATG